MHGLVIVPAFNEEHTIRDVILKIPRKIKNHGLDILVINDGSFDKTEKIARKFGVKVISHLLNRGLGAALGSGFEFARIGSYDFLVTLDGDGQHDPKEISKLLGPIFNKKADFVVGSRIFKEGMPAFRRLITFLASLATYVLTGVWTSDSQSGFRAFSKKAITVITIQVDKMEVSSDFFSQCREKNLRMVEIPITPIYTEYSLKKGQSLFNSFNIVGKLTLQKMMR